jgi:hypothetical protein
MSQDRIAVLDTGPEGMPVFVKIGHVSGNAVDVLHCPFVAAGR